MKNTGYKLPTLKLRNKKAVSEVIATMLIVLISVALIVVVAKFIIPFVKNSLTQSTECINYMNSYKFQESFYSNGNELRYNCFDKTNHVGFSVKGDASIENDSSLLGFDLILYEEGSSKKISIRKGDSSEIKMLSGNTSIQIPLRGEVRTYVYTKQGEGIFTSMEVHPVLASGRVCDVSDRIKLDVCLSSVSLG